MFGNIFKVARRDARFDRERYSLHSTVGKPRGQLRSASILSKIVSSFSCRNRSENCALPSLFSFMLCIIAISASWFNHDSWFMIFGMRARTAMCTCLTISTFLCYRQSYCRLCWKPQQKTEWQHWYSAKKENWACLGCVGDCTCRYRNGDITPFAP